jgi:hypothetical protein
MVMRFKADTVIVGSSGIRFRYFGFLGMNTTGEHVSSRQYACHGG